MGCVKLAEGVASQQKNCTRLAYFQSKTCAKCTLQTKVLRDLSFNSRLFLTNIVFEQLVDLLQGEIAGLWNHCKDG